MNLLIINASDWAYAVGIPLAKFIKKELADVNIGTVLMNYASYQHTMSDSFKYDYISNKMLLGDEVLSTDFYKKYGHISMGEIEETLGVDSVWKNIISAQRNLVYHPGKKQSYAWTQQVDDETLLNIVRVNYIYIKELFERFPPSIIITPNYISVFCCMLYHYAKKRNINMWRINTTKINSHYLLTDDILFNLKNVEKKYKSNDISEEAFDYAKDYIQKFRAQYIDPEGHENKVKLIERKRVTSVIKEAVTKFYKVPKIIFLNWRKKKGRFSLEVYKGSRDLPFIIRFRNMLLEYIYVEKALSLDYHVPKDDEDYFFLPMCVMPEENMMMWATYCTNQLEFARLVAMGLPGRYTLYVKEHPAMIGERKPKFYKKLMKTPNVKLLAPDTSCYSIVKNKNCKGVIGLAGTTPFEALLLQKPVISFGELFYSMVPQCYKLTDVTKITEAVREIEKNDFSSKRYEDALVRFVAALKSESIETSYVKAKLNKDERALAGIFAAFQKEIEKVI